MQFLDNREVVEASLEPQPARPAQTPHPRAVGAPLPRGGARRPALPAEPEARPGAPANGRAPEPDRAPAPGRALTTPAAQSDATQAGTEEHSSSVQRAAHALRNVVPFVQRLLPLLDGNFVTAVSNVLTPQPKPVPPLNLAPLQQGLNDVQVQQRELRDQMADQHGSLKRVEDHLELVREATDRNTLEQQELMEDLKAVGHKVNVVAFVALALLGVSVILNVLLYLHIAHILS